VLFPVLLSIWNWPLAVAKVLQYCGLVRSAHFVKHDSEGPHIDFGSDDGVLWANFRCYVAHGPTACFHPALAIELALSDVRETEVAHLDSWQFPFSLFFGSWSVKEEVLQLHVGVYDSLGMDVLKSIEDIERVSLELILIIDRCETINKLLIKVVCVVAILHEYYKFVFVFGVLVQFAHVIVLQA